MAEEAVEGLTETPDAEEGSKLKQAIEVDVSEAGTLRKAMRVTIPAEFVAEDRDGQYSELISGVVVPGFRKGHAPRKLIEKRYGSEVGEQVLTRLVSNGYLAAIEKADIKAIGDPVFKIKVTEKRRKESGGMEEVELERMLEITEALKHIKLPDEGALSFDCEVEVRPEFELPKLEGIAVEKPNVKITDEDIAKQVDRWRAYSGELAPVQDGGVEPDDMMIANVVIKVGKDHVKEMENVQLFARAQQIAGVDLGDFGEKLKGAKAGDTREVSGKLPDDFEVADYRGKDATFAITINDLKRLKLPPLNAEFLSARGFETEQDLRDEVRKQMEARLEDEIRGGMRGQISRYLLENTKLDLPEGLSSRTVSRAIIRRMLDLRRRGVPQGEIEKHADDLRTEAKESALAELKLSFIMEKIAEADEVEVSEEEINGRIASIAYQYGKRFDRVRDELAKDGGLETIYMQIRDDKCIDRLLEKAEIKESAGPETSLSSLADAT